MHRANKNMKRSVHVYAAVTSLRSEATALIASSAADKFMAHLCRTSLQSGIDLVASSVLSLKPHTESTSQYQRKSHALRLEPHAILDAKLLK